MTDPLPPATPLPAESDPALERFARLVRRQLGVPVALVTLVSAEEQVFPGAVGLPEPWQTIRRTPLSHSFCQHVVRSEEPLVIADARIHPLVADNLAIPDLHVVAYAGMPLTDIDGRVVGSLCAIDSRPRTWSADDLAVLADLAGACSSELRLRGAQRIAGDAGAAAQEASDRNRRLLAQRDIDRSHWALALEAGRVGTFSLELASGELTVDDWFFEVSGVDRAGFTGRPEDVYAHVHPDDLDDVVARVQEAITTSGAYDAEYRVVAADGQHRWVAARGHVVGGDDGTPAHLIGVLHDTTARRSALELAAQALESMAVGYVAMDGDWRVTYVNDEAERTLGRPRAELVGGVVWELFPATRGTDFEAGYRAAADTGQPYTFDAYYPEPLNAWYEIRANPEHGGVALYFTDITERVRAQQRSDLLGEVMRELNGTLDAEQAVAGLARLVVPALADWCVVTLVDDENQQTGSRRSLRDVGWWHTDAALRPVVEAYARHRLPALLDSSYLHQVLRSGRRASAATGATERIRAVLRPGPAHDLLGELAPESFAILPLRGRGRTAGLLTLFSGKSRAPMAAAELQVASDVAGRAGLALDNARLYRRQRQLAEGLQRSLLTEPAAPGHVQIVVRYTPAAETAQVGGDWYDAFPQPGGATIVTIGDVLGHNTEAAAAMGQLRSMLRAIAVTTDARPAEILTRVDEAMSALGMRTTATAVVLRLEQTEAQASRGVASVCWSNAGHPPPMVVGPDGAVRELKAPRADLLLGVEETTPRRDHEVELDRGCVLLLYTDGLVERRDSDLDAGLERLRRALADSAGRGLGELCDRLLARMLPPDVDDDVALIAVRLDPLDQPVDGSARSAGGQATSVRASDR